MKEQQNNDFIVMGSVVRAYFGGTKNDEKEKYRVTVKGDIPYEKITAYDSCGSKYTPSWLKKAEGYINLSSRYDIPVRIGSRVYTFEEWIDGEAASNTAIHAEVRMLVRQKEGAVYPVCIDVLTDGYQDDAFATMDEMLAGEE